MTKFLTVLVLAALPFVGRTASTGWGEFALVDMRTFSSGSYWLGCDGKGVVYPEIGLSVTDMGDSVGVVGTMLMDGCVGTWIECMMGDILAAKAFADYEDSFAYKNLESSGANGLQVGKGDTFYLGCMMEKLAADWPEDWVDDWSDPRIYSGEHVYGWASLTVEADGSLTLGGSAIDFTGNCLVVGAYGPIPEPSGCLLMVMGVAALGLRRVQRKTGEE